MGACCFLKLLCSFARAAMQMLRFKDLVWIKIKTAHFKTFFGGHSVEK